MLEQSHADTQALVLLKLKNPDTHHALSSRGLLSADPHTPLMDRRYSRNKFEEEQGG